MHYYEEEPKSTDMPEKYPKVGTCPFCGAPIYDISKANELPVAHFTCDCRLRLVPFYPTYPTYSTTWPIYPIYPIKPTYPTTWPNTTYPTSWPIITTWIGGGNT